MKPGDIVRKKDLPKQVAQVTYVDADDDYLELAYVATGFPFRARMSEWEVAPLGVASTEDVERVVNDPHAADWPPVELGGEG